MTPRLAFPLLLAAACSATPEPPDETPKVRDPVALVNPFIGTGGYAFGHGEIMPQTSNQRPGIRGQEPGFGPEQRLAFEPSINVDS